MTEDEGLEQLGAENRALREAFPRVAQRDAKGK